MIILDFKDTRPIYEQVVEKFKILILKGVLETDEQMPSVRSLAVELSVNPNTVQKAYAELERHRYIYSVKGRGNFVSDKSLLLDERKEEMKKKILALYFEAREIGIGKTEWMELVQNIEDKASPDGGKGGKND